MSKYGSDKAWLQVNGYALTGYLTDFSHDVEAVLEECTVLGNTFQVQQYAGLRKTTIDLNGYYDDAAKASVEALSTRAGVSGVMCYGVAGETKGKLFTGFYGAMQSNVSRVASRGAIHKMSAKFVGDGLVEDGIVLRAMSSATASTGNTQSNSYDAGASSTRGGAGYFQLNDLVLDGTSTGFTATIRHSADDVTFVDLVTFSEVTSSGLAPKAQRVATVSTAPVNRYLAAAWAQASTAANSTTQATFFAGFYRGIAVP